MLPSNCAPRGPDDLSRRPGLELPVLGFGVWQVPDGPAAVKAVRSALDAGYRHVDTAQGYGNESSVGRALRESGLSRDEVFITTKLDPGLRDPVAAAEASLERLGVEQIDLYLVHWPLRGPTGAWPGMQQALERGLTRNIGISNFDGSEVEALLAVAEVPPAVNQIELSPFTYRRELLGICERYGIAIEAYSPLTHGTLLDDPTLGAVARGAGRTPAQVLLRWGLQHGFAVIPKSVRPERIVENADIFDFALDEADMATLDGLDRTGGTERAVEEKWWSRRARARDRVRRAVGRIRA